MNIDLHINVTLSILFQKQACHLQMHVCMLVIWYIFIYVFLTSWLVKSVHGPHFSKCGWEKFLSGRAVPASAVSFAEIEVLLCDIPSLAEIMDEEEEERRLKEGETLKFHVPLLQILSCPQCFTNTANIVELTWECLFRMFCNDEIL